MCEQYVFFCVPSQAGDLMDVLSLFLQCSVDDGKSFLVNLPNVDDVEKQSIVVKSVNRLRGMRDTGFGVVPRREMMMRLRILSLVGTIVVMADKREIGNVRRGIEVMRGLS